MGPASGARRRRTGFEMTRRLALGAASAAALARSRTIDALVLKRSYGPRQLACYATIFCFPLIPSRDMPGFRGTPAGISTTSAPVRASRSPEGVGG